MKSIEVLGIQGSGKTTIIPIVKNILQSIGKSVYDKNDLMTYYYIDKYSLHFFLNIPVLKTLIKKMSYFPVIIPYKSYNPIP